MTAVAATVGGAGDRLELRPRTPTEIMDAAVNLIRARPALLLVLGSSHVAPLGIALACLGLLPGRAFTVTHPSLPLLALALLGAIGVLLRPMATAATAVAVRALARGEEPDARSTVAAVRRRGFDLATAALAALVVDVATFGLLRLAGVRHTLAALVVIEGLAPRAARREASRFAAAFTRHHLLLGGAHALLFLLVAVNARVGCYLGVEILGILSGVDLSMARRFVSFENGGLMIAVLLGAGLLLEPLHAVAKGVLYVDLRLREEGTDLLVRLERLG